MKINWSTDTRPYLFFIICLLVLFIVSAFADGELRRQKREYYSRLWAECATACKVSGERAITHNRYGCFCTNKVHFGRKGEE